MTPISLEPLVTLIAKLRGPDGCPWDQEQTLESLRAYLLEEAHEVAAAIDTGDAREVSEELGDLLFHIAFAAALAEESGGAPLQDVVDASRDKMIERHPHVFGDERVESRAETERAWERRKARSNRSDASILDGVPDSLPALLGAYRMTQKAAGVGFDWPDVSAVLAKVREELGELEHELLEGSAEIADHVAAELGDLLFAVANLCRHLDVDPEGALARTNGKFRRRFRHIERRLQDTDRPLDGSSLSELDALWEEAKQRERHADD